MTRILNLRGPEISLPVATSIQEDATIYVSPLDHSLTVEYGFFHVVTLEPGEAAFFVVEGGRWIHKNCPRLRLLWQRVKGLVGYE